MEPLGHALAAATGTPWPDLVSGRLLRPLGLRHTAPRAGAGAGTDATGHGKDGTAVPGFDAGGFGAAGAVRATPHDLLTFLEAHLDPARCPPLAGALHAVRTPVLRRGLGHRHVHTVAWFRHPADGGPFYFHSGATLGQQTFLGFRPATALAAVCTRRFRAHDPFLATAYALLAGEYRSGGQSRCHSAGVPAGAHTPCAWWVCRHWYVTPSRVTVVPAS